MFMKCKKIIYKIWPALIILFLLLPTFADRRSAEFFSFHASKPEGRQFYVFSGNELLARGPNVALYTDRYTNKSVYTCYDALKDAQEDGYPIYIDTGRYLGKYKIDAFLAVTDRYICCSSAEWLKPGICTFGVNMADVFYDDVIFVDQRTGKIVWQVGHASVSHLDKDRFVVCKSSEKEGVMPTTMIVSKKNLRVLETYTDLQASCKLAMYKYIDYPDGLLRCYNKDREQIYMYVDTGEEYSDFASANKEYIVTGSVNNYSVYSLSTGKLIEKIEKDFVSYYSDKIMVWRDNEKWYLQADEIANEPVEVCQLNSGHGIYQSAENEAVFYWIDEETDQCSVFDFSDEEEVSCKYDHNFGYAVFSTKDAKYYCTSSGEKYRIVSDQKTTALISAKAPVKVFLAGEQGNYSILSADGTVLVDQIDIVHAAPEQTSFIVITDNDQLQLLDTSGRVVWKEVIS